MQNNEWLYDTDGLKIHRGKTEKTKEFTYKFMISCEGTPEVPLDSLSEEQLCRVKDRMRKNLEDGMSEYYTLYPEEYKSLLSMELM